MKLADYLDAHDLTQKMFADIIGCEQPTVARFLAGRLPSKPLMERIIVATAGQVNANDWFDSPIDAGASSPSEAA